MNGEWKVCNRRLGSPYSDSDISVCNDGFFRKMDSLSDNSVYPPLRSNQCQNASVCAHTYEDAVCQPDCNSPQCGFDGGDCVEPVGQQQQRLLQRDQQRRASSHLYLIHFISNTRFTPLLSRMFLARLAMTMRAVVKIARKNDTGKELSMEMNGPRGAMKVSEIRFGRGHS